MCFVWRQFILLAIALLCCSGSKAENESTTSEPQPEPELEPEPEPEPDGLNTKLLSKFLEPSKHNDHIDSFTLDKNEYLFINFKMTYNLARLICHSQYKGKLAWINKEKYANFLAEALTETNMVLDTLWSGGRKRDEQWEWFESTYKKEAINEEIVKKFVEGEVNATDRNCLGFNRADHDVPQYRPLACTVERGFICQRLKTARPTNETTHPGWIKIGKRLYKIFVEEVSYNTAIGKCMEHDSTSSLAVVVNYNDSQSLGRYLLIGRPSLENAWIGANWVENSYTFEKENIILPSTTNMTTKYPPWRKNATQKTDGCILLDRHLSNIALFVEARCHRARSYICYKIDETSEDITSTDIVIAPHVYRLIFNKRSWEDARKICSNFSQENRDVKLVELTEKEMVMHVLYVMGENKTAIQHVWIGGQLKGNIWKWTAAGVTIDKEYLGWVHNDSYTESVEAGNTCLNLDRENHVTPLTYGTDCSEPQSFICYFKQEGLQQLQKEERLGVHSQGSVIDTSKAEDHETAKVPDTANDVDNPANMPGEVVTPEA